MKKIDVEIIIVGGGHAGLEATNIAIALGARTALITLPGISFASTPCNPAVGGVGKGNVVREIDILGGVMGKLADQSALQYRTLNESRGYAVRSTRAQVDKNLYSNNAEKYFSELTGLLIVRDKVLAINKTNYGFEVVSENNILRGKKVVLTTGTFLNGKTHIGKECNNGGRYNKPSSSGLCDLLKGLSINKKRFKTGTPPRIKGETIDFSVLEAQESDISTKNFHFLSNPFQRTIAQLDCHITHTNIKTMDVIRKNKEKSPIFNGQISGVGPRYCPSIEDKAYRYPDKGIHHVFVEPETLDMSTFYPNGLSTSLPREIQLEYIRSIKGFENAELEVYGYAVEYDVIDTTELDKTLQFKKITGLYSAGQINGTSGYEEAAGQGLIAGINAVFSLKNKDPFIIDRNDSYIGVMIEDLVSNFRDEPYRLFTARAENRLLIREDNVVNRIAPYRKQLGLHEELDKRLEMFHVEHSVLSELVKSTTYLPSKENSQRFKVNGYMDIKHNSIRMEELLSLSHLFPIKTLQKELDHFGLVFDYRVIECVAIEMKYKGYLEQKKNLKKYNDKLLRKKINWQEIILSENISFECKERIEKIMPETFGQLKRINGIRQATLSVVASTL